jgi:hypothetical protein
MPIDCLALLAIPYKSYQVSSQKQNGRDISGKNCIKKKTVNKQTLLLVVSPPLIYISYML